MNFLVTLLEKSVTFTGGEGTAAVTEAVSEQVTSSTYAGGAMSGGVSGGVIMIVWILVLFGFMYFFTIRPQKKREEQLKEMQNEIKVGDWVMTSSGFYGKVADVYDKNVVVEFGLNKGIRIPVVKSEIYGNTEPNLSNKPQEETENK